jgi:hypothetical protein
MAQMQQIIQAHHDAIMTVLVKPELSEDHDDMFYRLP